MCVYLFIHQWFIYIFAFIQAESGSNADEVTKKKKTVPYMWNLNFDPQLSNKITHFLDGQKTLGNQKGETSDICLMGPRLVKYIYVIPKQRCLQSEKQ